MKKEVVIAIIIGLSLGLVVTYGIYRAKTSLSSGQQAASTTNDASPTPPGSVHNSLKLLSPEDESVQANNEVKVTGATDPDAIVIIFMNEQPKVIHADKSGNFSIQATLQAGSNVITVRTLDEEGNSVEEQRTVIFTTASFEDTPVATPSGAVQVSPTPKASPKPSATVKVSPSPKSSPTP